MNATVTATSSSVQVVGFDLLTPLLQFIFGADGFIGFVSLGGVFSALNIIWGIFIVLAYGAALIMLFLYVYASMQREKLEELEAELYEAGEHAYAMQQGGATKSDRFTELQSHLESNNPNDWKLAIIEADIILDDLLKRKGYVGVSLGDRLKSISPSSLASLDDAWQAHKVRNQIAHAGADFVLTQKIARETIVQYERVFKEMGVH